MKKFLASILVLTIAITSILGLIGCNANQKVKTPEEYSYVTLKINPEVDFVVDKNSKVVSYCCLNEDAEVLLSDLTINGNKIEEATETIVDEAVKAGYIDVGTEGENVNIGAINKDGNEDNETCDRIKKKLNNYFENKGIFGKVSKITLDLYLEKSKKYNLSVGHTKFLMLACERSGKSLEELKDKPINELMSIIHENNGKRMNGKKADKTKQNQRMHLKNNSVNGNSKKLQDHQKNFNNKESVKKNIRDWQNKK